MHKLIQLPYAYDALEPTIDAKTMEIHHSKHHQGYVDKLNNALSDHEELQEKSIQNLLRDLESVPESIRTAVRNNGGGVANHNLFFTTIGPGGSQLSKCDLAEAINEFFGSFQSFQEAFGEAATGRFGSGWAWLSLDSNGKLLVESTANQDSPYMFGRTPVVGLDVWEHAYYLKYQNRRAEYISAWWNIVDWKAVATRFEECCTTGRATS